MIINIGANPSAEGADKDEGVDDQVVFQIQDGLTILTLRSFQEPIYFKFWICLWLGAWQLLPVILEFNFLPQTI